MSRRCPYCGRKLEIWEYSYVCPYCGYEEPLSSQIQVHEEDNIIEEVKELEEEEEKEPEEFDSGLELIEECPYMTNVEIVIPPEIMAKIRAIVEIVEDYEFTAFLIHEKIEEEDGITYVVKDIVIPKQKVTSTSVDVDVQSSREYPNAGIIHYHPFEKGRPDFSVIDEVYVNSNRPFSIVVGKTMKMTAVARVPLPCGHIAKVEAKITTIPKLSKKERKKLKKIIEENIEKETTTYTWTKWRKWKHHKPDYYYIY